MGMGTLPVWLAIFSGQRLYNIRFIGRRIDEVRRIVNATFLGSLAVALVAFFLDIDLPRSRIAVLFVMVTILVDRSSGRWPGGCSPPCGPGAAWSATW